MIASRLERMIPDATGIISVIVMMCAFLLSFCNLQAMAIESGINPWLSWAWPVCVDALLIAGSLMILRASLRLETTYFGWFVLAAFTAVSTAFNIAHSPGELLSRAAHAIPPLALMVSVEAFTRIIKSDLQKGKEEVIVTVQPEPEPKEVYPTQKRISDEEITAFYAEHPGSMFLDAADNLGMSRQTISRRVNILVSQGKMRKDDDGKVYVL